jgi:uncharacterized protein YdcH (DUF465 family)
MMTRHLANHLERLLDELRGLKSPQEEMKLLKRLRLRLKDRIAALERNRNGPTFT